MELSKTQGHSTVPSQSLSQVLRRHPLLCYFLPVFLIWHAPFVPGMAPGLFLGPALSVLLRRAMRSHVLAARPRRRHPCWNGCV
jgi:hypothetical protein